MKINPRRLSGMMRQLGMQMKTIDAKEVIIKANDREIVIRNPEVAKINLMGRDVFQISGNVEERAGVREEDIKFVMESTGETYERAKSALEEAGDIAGAIALLKKKGG